MKLIPLLLLTLAMLAGCTGCTSLDAANGRYYTMGDNTGVKMKFKAGQCTSYEVAANVHTPVTKAHWHGVNNAISEAALALAGGGPGAVAAVIPPIVNRPTSRVDTSTKGVTK